MHIRRAGFVLIIVLGLLGVLAFVALNFAQRSQQATFLSRNHMDKVRSRLMARSGIELALVRIQGALPEHSGVHARYVGDGTRRAHGDHFRVSIQDASGAINLNDGLESAFKERGDDLADNAMQAMEEVPITVVPGDVYLRRYCFGGGGGLSQVQAGDRVNVWDAYPNGSVEDRTVVTGISSILRNAGGTMVFEETLEVEHLLPVTSGNFDFEIVRDKPLGFFNLRLRHLLNAYGDAHRFVEQYDWPVWSRSQWSGGDLGQYGSVFTPTSTALGDVEDPTPGLNAAGLPIIPDVPATVALSSTGLGDRLIAARPRGGYARLDQIEEVVKSWSQEHMNTQVGRARFKAQVTRDFTIHSAVDSSFTRIKREFGSRRKPKGRDVKHSGQLLGADNPLMDSWATDNQYQLKSMPRGLFDFSSLFTDHAVAPINVSSASEWVRAAVFWAPTNVGYVAESVRTAFDTVVPHDRQWWSLYHLDPNSHVSNPERFVGVSEPVFEHSTMENGLNVAVTSNRFMSLRDALVTSQAYREYLETVGPIHTVDSFGHFLKWRRDNAVDYEKVRASGLAYNPHRVNGGHFTQDYAEETLPHVLGCLRRIPGYLGAPQPLISPYKELDPLEWTPLNPPLTRTYGDAYSAVNEWDWLRFHAGSHPAVKVEDFVSRETLPKVCFQPQGIYRLVSRGHVDDAGSLSRAATVIETDVEAFKMLRARSQKDFLSLTDPAQTSTSIRLGPELQGSPRYPEPHLGVVGLKDAPDDPTIFPALCNNFTHDMQSQIGPSPLEMPFQDPVLSWLWSLSSQAHNWFETPTSFRSMMEGASAPFLGNLSGGCDLSPFNGVNLLSFGHGPNPEPAYQRFFVVPPDAPSTSIWNFTDSLYWRPAMDPSYGGHLLQPNRPTGDSAGVGSVSLWFRVPSGDRFPGDETYVRPSTLQPVRTRTRGAFHMLCCLNLWEVADQWWFSSGGPIHVDEGRPVTLQLGYVYDTTLRRGKLVGRFETRNRSLPPVPIPDERPLFPEFFSNSFGYLDWPRSNSIFGQSTDFMGLYNRDWPIHEMFRTYDKVQVATTSITLKDIPENGPGSWHRVTFAWSGKFEEANPLTLTLHDASNIESQSPVSFEENHGVGPMGPEPYDMMPWDSCMTLSLGEAHARCRIDPSQHPFFSGDGADVNGDFTRGFQDYAAGRYLPAWRLDSSIDNVRLYLGSQGDVIPRPERYEVTHEPAWSLDAARMIPRSARITGVGARIFEPLDENQNFPLVEISMVDPGGTQLAPESDLALDRSLGRVTERAVSFGSVPADGSRVFLTYRNITPSADPLINNGADNWAEIPWIMEVSLRYSEGAPRILSWKMDP